MFADASSIGQILDRLPLAHWGVHSGLWWLRKIDINSLIKEDIYADTFLLKDYFDLHHYGTSFPKGFRRYGAANISSPWLWGIGEGLYNLGLS